LAKKRIVRQAWNLVGLDGYFEGPKKWDLDFHERVWGPELEQLAFGSFTPRE
jgi:hypothetical protein